MIILLASEIGFIISGLMILLGHTGLADKSLIGVFFITLFGVMVYSFKLFKNDQKQ